MIAVLFGGPLDGDVREIKEFTTRLLYPMRREIRYAKEGEIQAPYTEEIYDYQMHLSNDEALYVYRTK